MLTAMSSGGRVGRDAPYMPRGCDMRWFSTEEICEILSRFEKVIIVGDSMMRHLIGSINVLIRKDLGYGAVTDWNFSLEERYAILPSAWLALNTTTSDNMTDDTHETGGSVFAIINSMLKPAPFRVSSKPPTL